MIDEHKTIRLMGLSAIVTGAGSGIGRACARALANAGASVLAVGRRADKLAETAGGDPAIVPFAIDLRADHAPGTVVDAATQQWGKLDLLVNNAGVFAALPLDKVTAANLANMIAINVTAPSLLTSAALPALRKSRGCVVNLSSTFGHRPAPGFAHYGATKAAIEHLTRSWAAELAPDGVRVNAVAPGPTESEALIAAGLPEPIIAEIKAAESARVPLGRRGKPEEVARWILHFADPGAAWVTGQVIAIDGGLAVA